MGKQRGWVPNTPGEPEASPAKPEPASQPAPIVEAQVTLSNGTVAESATIARRFGALLVDWILCLLIAGIFADPRQTAWIPSVVLIIEYGFFIGLFRQTPGMFVTSVRCVSIADGRSIGIIFALVRGFLLALLIPAVIMDGQRRGWHDRVAGSIVIAAPRSAKAA